MKKYRKIILIALSFALLSTIYSLLFTSEVQAVCPVCTVVVGAGLGLSRFLGIDDTISGIWIGGLLVSLSLWSADWSKTKFESLKSYKKSVLTFAFFAFWTTITFLPLCAGNIIGDPLNTILGIDKLIFGSLLGVSTFLFSFWLDRKIRKIKGEQLFNYQKVVFPVFFLAVISLLMYYYGGYLY